MATRRIGWAAAHREEAVAYVDAVNAYYAANIEPPDGVFTEPSFLDGGAMKIVQDLHLQWNATWFGPPFAWNNVEVEEPPELAALRPNGVIMPTWEPPEE